MAEVSIADTGLFSIGFNTMRRDKEAMERALEAAASNDYVRICETDDEQLHTC